MKISVWLHAVLSGPRIPNEDHTLAIFCEQMRALKESGLSRTADSVNVGLNGPDGDAMTALSMMPENARLHLHPAGQTEIPTLYCLRLSLEPGWLVLYHQMKGAQHPGEALYEGLRHCMERACVWNWLHCVTALQLGSDACGCHWLTPEKYPQHVSSPYFGGTFWWAKSEYLMQLPPLPPDTWENRYEAESWIGRRRPYPRITDFHPVFPGGGCA
jgi:hypothetical protein